MFTTTAQGAENAAAVMDSTTSGEASEGMNSTPMGDCLGRHQQEEICSGNELHPDGGLFGTTPTGGNLFGEGGFNQANLNTTPGTREILPFF
ncbi:hypothetical protein QTG54_015783 [Skeletonema marinoi]|uniref:Uncharacterized protein n=1 Tax=Skeletonema marinoi TaxID=267567 RepID=A0AAD8XU95_9STRA|nr:hypothetical protein QTG54_015783 [Skeletonema marinoi]